MTAFAAAVDVLFSDQNMSVAAIYIRPGDIPRDVRVVLIQPDVAQDFGAARVSTDSMVIEARVSEVERPSRGDRFVIGDEHRVVQGVPRRDRERLVWTIDTGPA